MRALLLGFLFLGLTSLCFAQVDDREKLKEVEVFAKNTNYLKHVKSDDLPTAITELERKVANFDVKNLDTYSEIYDTYKVLFFIPEGEISAWYDNNSNVLITIEKFDDIKLPRPVLNSVLKQYPDWNITSDIYTVNYHHLKGAKKWYKLHLENDNKKIRIKTDENGNLL